MTEASKWRFEMAEKIAASYGKNPKVRAIMVAGSTGRGVAGQYGFGFDTMPYRERLKERRQVWDHSPK